MNEERKELLSGGGATLAAYTAEELLRMKHEYNKTRSYRHNNKVC